MELLIESGANLELPNNHGYTALHSAVHYGRSEIVAVLLQSGADVHAVTYDSQVRLSGRLFPSRAGTNLQRLHRPTRLLLLRRRPSVFCACDGRVCVRACEGVLCACVRG